LTKFDEVTERFGDVRYMGEPQATFLRDFIVDNDLRRLLEIGFYQGKSSSYIAAILEDRGGDGHLTTIDRASARDKTPGIDDLLGELELAHRVTPVWADRSYTWELGRMVREGIRDTYDFCYFDGGHTWDPTGFGFVLVDMLLKPGGWIIFDDLDWTIQTSIAHNEGRAAAYAKYGEDELHAKNVRMVFETLVPHFGYGARTEEQRFRWGIAQKPHRRD
jgi:predicted O-methyltransferase YrrM